MKDNRLFNLLRSFSRKEMTRFREFSASPSFNKHKDVQNLVCVLDKYFPVYNEKNCNRNRLFKQLFPGEDHDQAKLALIFTYTIRTVEDFLIQEEFKDLKGFKKILLLRKLRKIGQFKFYDKVLKSHNKDLKDSASKDSNYYNLTYLTATEADQFYTEKAAFEKNNSILIKQDNLDYFYFSEKLKDGCEMVQRSKMFQVSFNPGFLESILEKIEADLSAYVEIPPIIIYYRIFKMLTEPDPSYFFKAKDAIGKFENYFLHDEKINLYNYLQNYSIQQVNLGSKDFLKELFEVYKLQLEKGFLYLNETLPEWYFKNIVSNGLQLKEMEWVKDFIEQYKVKLHPDVLENAYSFNLASYYHATGQYQNVLELLLKVEYTDIRYSLGAKILLLKTYYEREEYEALISLSDSFKQYLIRNKTIAEIKRKGYNNLIRLSRKCFQVKMNKAFTSSNKHKKEVQKLQDLLKKTEPIFNQSWLEAKLSEL